MIRAENFIEMCIRDRFLYVWSLQPGGIRGNRCVDGTVLQPCAAEQLELHALDRLDGAEREHHGADGGLRRRFVGIAGGKLFGEDDGTERTVDRDVGQLRPCLLYTSRCV